MSAAKDSDILGQFEGLADTIRKDIGIQSAGYKVLHKDDTGYLENFMRDHFVKMFDSHRREIDLFEDSIMRMSMGKDQRVVIISKIAELRNEVSNYQNNLLNHTTPQPVAQQSAAIQPTRPRASSFSSVREILSRRSSQDVTVNIEQLSKMLEEVNNQMLVSAIGVNPILEKKISEVTEAITAKKKFTQRVVE